MFYMFKTLLASLSVEGCQGGFGAGTGSDYVTTGEEVTGQIRLTGGKVKQTIQGLSVDFRLRSEAKETIQNFILQQSEGLEGVE